MKLGSMNHLRLTVSDIPRAERFYSAVRKGSSTRHDRYACGFHHLALNADTREQVDALHAMSRATTRCSSPIRTA